MTGKRKGIPQPVKDKLYTDARHRCCICPQHEHATIDLHHIVPVYKGGPNTEENLLVLCPNCHTQIHRQPNKFTVRQLKIYKKEWIELCAKGISVEMLIPSLHNQTPPERNFVGRKEMLKTITGWYHDSKVRVGALIAWGGEGKSALVREWYDSLEEYKVRPDGIFWWGFYRNAYLDPFLNALLRYVSQGEIDPDSIRDTGDKADRIKDHICKRAYLIILDGLEQMQKGQETGEEFGCMAHKECTEILRFLCDTKAKGLCLITTRYPLTDIEDYEGTTYQEEEVERLGLQDARALFEKVGLKGSQEDKDDVIKEYEGHALSLTLLANYLAEDFDSDIQKAPKIPPLHSDKEAGGKARRILLWYEDQLTPEQQSFMKIFSLFRTAVREEDFKGVFRTKMGTKMNQILRDMCDFPFNRMKHNLYDRRLLSEAEDNTYATHPLIKNYFESIFEEKDKRLCHKRIYQHIDSYAPEGPDTLEQMQPLFEQVYHGCAAGLYDEVLDHIYWEKINRENEDFITDKLGAWGTVLALLRDFFPEGDWNALPRVRQKEDQSWLRHEVGLALLSTGHPEEAEWPLLAGAEMDEKAADWDRASTAYQLLAYLELRTGKINTAPETAQKALERAQKADRKSKRKDLVGSKDLVKSKVCLAHICHLSGKKGEAEEWFDKVAPDMKGDSKDYSDSRAHYADFLICTNELDEALDLTKHNLEVCGTHDIVNDISRCNRCLAAIMRIKGNRKKAEGRVREALELARKVGVPELEIEARIEYGRLYVAKGQNDNAISAANEVLRLCKRTGFLLYEPDAEVILGKAHLAQKHFEPAKKFANSARSKARKMGYKLAQNDAEALLKEIQSKMK